MAGDIHSVLTMRTGEHAGAGVTFLSFPPETISGAQPNSLQQTCGGYQQ